MSSAAQTKSSRSPSPPWTGVTCCCGAPEKPCLPAQVEEEEISPDLPLCPSLTSSPTSSSLSSWAPFLFFFLSASFFSFSGRMLSIQARSCWEKMKSRSLRTRMRPRICDGKTQQAKVLWESRENCGLERFFLLSIIFFPYGRSSCDQCLWHHSEAPTPISGSQNNFFLFGYVVHHGFKFARPSCLHL